MDDLEKIVYRLNNTDLKPEQVTGILSMKNNNKQDALILACKLEMPVALKKLLEFKDYIKSIKYVSDKEMVRAAEVGGSGNFFDVINKRKRESKKIVSFDILNKDIFGNSALDYAIDSNNKSLLSLICFFRTDELSSIKIDGMDSLSYFISKLCCLKKEDKNIDRYCGIVDKLTCYDNLSRNINSDFFSKYISFYCSNDLFKNENIDSFENIVKVVSKECLDKAFDSSIRSINSTNMLNVIQNVQQLLMKYGAKITREQLEFVKYFVMREYYKGNEKLKQCFDETYNINPYDFNTIVGKPKQVIELYFGKNYEDVLVDYIQQQKITYESLVIAAHCKYDHKDSRIGILKKLGANVNLVDDNGKSIFWEFNTQQIYDIFQYGEMELSDEEILAVSCHSFANKKYKYSFEKVDKIYKSVINHNVSGDIDFYKNKILKSNIFNDMENIYQFFGVSEFYDEELEKNLNSQMKKRLELEKEKLLNFNNNQIDDLDNNLIRK